MQYPQSYEPVLDFSALEVLARKDGAKLGQLLTATMAKGFIDRGLLTAEYRQIQGRSGWVFALTESGKSYTS